MRINKDPAWTTGLKTVDSAIEICKSCLKSHRKIGINFQEVPNNRIAFWLRDWLDVFLGHVRGVRYEVEVRRVDFVFSIEFDAAYNADADDEESSFQARTSRLFIFL